MDGLSLEVTLRGKLGVGVVVVAWIDCSASFGNTGGLLRSKKKGRVGRLTHAVKPGKCRKLAGVSSGDGKSHSVRCDCHMLVNR